MKRKRSALYCRCSSEESADSGLSIAVQERVCRKAAEDHGFVVADVFKDEGFSAYLDKPRPSFEQMMARLGEFDVIVVWKLDRWGRRVLDIHGSLETLRQNGVGFLSVTENFDLSSPMGRAMMGVTADFAELWSALTQERVRDAVHQAAREGRKHSYPPFGYVRPQPKGTIVPDPATAPVVRRIFDEYANGQSIVQICRGLQRDGVKTVRGNDVWSTAAVRMMLERKTYIGKIEHSRTGQVFDGLHDAIVDRDLWDRCQSRLQGNKGVPSRARVGSLGPLLRCGYCGARMCLSNSQSRYRSYFCRQRLLSDRQHQALFIKTEIAEAYIWLVVEEMMLPEAEAIYNSETASCVVSSDAEVGKLRDEREMLEADIRYNLRAARDAGLPINMLAEENKPLQDRLHAVEQRLRELSEQAEQPFRTDMRQALSDVMAGGYEQQRQYLSKIFTRIECFSDCLVFHSVLDLKPLVVMRQRSGGHGIVPERLQMG